MTGSYSRGYDLPPLLRDSLIGDRKAAASFASLSAQRQDEIVSGCGRMTSSGQIDEYIKLTDNFLYSDMICSEFTPEGGRFL